MCSLAPACLFDFLSLLVVLLSAEADQQSDATQAEGASVRSIGQVLKEATAAEKQRTAAAFVDSLKQQPASEGTAEGINALPILLDSSLTGAGKPHFHDSLTACRIPP